MISVASSWFSPLNSDSYGLLFKNRATPTEKTITINAVPIILFFNFGLKLADFDLTLPNNSLAFSFKVNNPLIYNILITIITSKLL
ncbi:hypothetical protein SDC9_151525 [bioreactor metagenome]|uniref:Uncharacterized protein n=1 Tax=bioreactor metagenome TaxID=1076179 RepID=A0A645ESW1_9ZZZZ